MKVVGVLGGMGPAATVDFMARVLAATPVARDQDHLRMIVDQNPLVPNRNEAVAGTGPSPGPVLAEMARGLERAGAELLAMPCNAAHAFADAVRGATALPFVDMIAATVAASPPVATVGVLGSSGCLDAGLYQRAFGARGVKALVPEGALRARFMDMLYRIKAGDLGEAVRAEMREIAAALVDRGAEAIVAGCTEVPLVLAAGDVGVALVNSTDALVGAVLEAASS